jgi:predicted nucleic acid-binding protein
VIVLDASALVELLLHTSAGRVIVMRIAEPALGLHVPHLADVEVAQALRRYARDGEIDTLAAAAALEDLHAFDLQRHAHEPLLDRVWELRNKLSAYDESYVALAEALETVVLTSDGRLARAPGVTRRVEVVRPTS